MVDVIVLEAGKACVQRIVKFSEKFIRKTFLNKDAFGGEAYGKVPYKDSVTHCKVDDKVVVTAYDPDGSCVYVIGNAEFFQDNENNFPYLTLPTINKHVATLYQNSDTRDKYTVMTMVFECFDIRNYVSESLEELLSNIMNDTDKSGSEALIKFSGQHLAYTIEDTILGDKCSTLYFIDICYIKRKHTENFLNRLQVNGIVPKDVYFTKVFSDLTVQIKKVK
jgi:hypothetical protein